MSAELRMVEGEGEEPEDRMIGRTIDGRYEVEATLGEGGMGLVYRARHIVLNKPLAIKVLRPDVSRDEEIITRFRQEAQSASAIGNQHIIDISDFGILEDKSTYFVMEFLDGIDLTGAIEEAPGMDPKRVVHIAKQLCRALGAAHDVGIVHRDLKPDNVYLIRRGGDSNFVKVLDFGIAKVGGTSSKLTRAGQVFGTPHYMSPEQCAGSGVDHRTDIYALGVMLYEMCTGECPFDADNLMGILTKHLYEEPVPPRQKNPSLPEDLEMVILRAMTKQADARYQTMDELLEDLERVEAGVGTMARESTRSHVLANNTVDGIAPPAVGGGNRTALIAGAAVLLLALVGGGVYVATSSPDPVIAETPPVIPDPVVEDPTEDPVVEDGVVEDAVGATDAPAMVRVSSEPAGAEVWRDGARLGVTPYEIRRPDGDSVVELELRAPGHHSRRFSLDSSATPAIDYVLAPRSTGTSRMTTRVRMHSPMETVQETAMEPVMMEAAMMETPMMTTRPHTEVLDPWATDG